MGVMVENLAKICPKVKNIEVQSSSGCSYKKKERIPFSILPTSNIDVFKQIVRSKTFIWMLFSLIQFRFNIVFHFSTITLFFLQEQFCKSTRLIAQIWGKIENNLN